MAYAELSYEKYLTYFKTLTSIELKKYEATEICKKISSKIYTLEKDNDAISTSCVSCRKPFFQSAISNFFKVIGSALIYGLYGGIVGVAVGLIVRMIYLSNKSYSILSYIWNLLFGSIYGLDISLLQFLLLGFATVGIIAFAVKFIQRISYNNSLPTQNEVLKKQQTKIAYNKICIKRLNEQKQYYKKTIDDLENCLVRYYSVGLINREAFGGLVATGTIYAYFSNKICNTLYGDKGALSRYDYEVKYRIIIAKLNEIIDALHTIEGNQRLLADMLETGNRNISKMCNTVNDRLESANYKLDTINYCQNVNNDNMKYLTWLNSGYWKF